jgi:hypothetical protein
MPVKGLIATGNMVVLLTGLTSPAVGSGPELVRR